MSDNCIVKIVSIQTQVFKILIESLKDVLKDVNIIFTKNHISLVATNQINSLFVKLVIQTNKLEEYSCVNNSYRIGVNIPSLHRLLKMAHNTDDILMFFIEENDKTNLGINLENKNKNIITQFKLKLLDLEPDPENFDFDKKIDYKNVISINSSDFHSLIKNMNNIAEYVEIKFDNINTMPILSLKCQGDFAQQYSVYKINENPVSNIKIKKFDISDSQNGCIQGLYLLKDTSLFSKCSQISEDVDLEMANGLPICLCYKVGNLGNLYLLLSSINNSDYDEKLSLSDNDNNNNNDNNNEDDFSDDDK